MILSPKFAWLPWSRRSCVEVKGSKKSSPLELLRLHACKLSPPAVSATSSSQPTTIATTMPVPPPIREGLSARADPNKSSLLQLPGELRNKICGYVFGNQEVRHVQPLPDKVYRKQAPTGLNNKSAVSTGMIISSKEKVRSSHRH